MSFPNDRRSRGSTGRSTLGYWVPLVVTVTVATFGVAAWIWSERQDGDDDKDYDSSDPPSGSRPPPGYADLGRGETSFGEGAEAPPVEDEGVLARMSGALRRTPSPQQIYDGAKGRFAAGMAAVGGALSSIREEERDDFGDHSRWSEEVRRDDVAAQSAQSAGAVNTNMEAFNSSAQTAPTQAQGRPGVLKRKTVAVVVSAETNHDPAEQEDNRYYMEHASILSHLPEHVDNDTMRVFVLVYAPDVKQLGAESSARTAGSVTSSYSNIGQEDLQTPAEELEKPLIPVEPRPLSSSSAGPEASRAPAPLESSSPALQAIYTQARALVENDAMILPFSTRTGYVHLLRHLAPEVVYIQESLSGDKGEAVTSMSGWVGQIIVVLGDEGGHGGLVDSEDETNASQKEDNWWEDSDKVGFGKGIDVVDGLRVGEDWARRVGAHE
ncbi:hypothetical protein L228DRAFT_218350 [Xylona heveae TC161]|uniref:Uncharacterized protein n=1 Tax=Xylona heveae (strain CBS 132557 / TC161) TaxID=1328760 RepID=A0A165HWI2_XYLHT|nr:hypothetical protein L228DRAFT_218350 [Xylona heveae TC161]KZF24024.1 hypothetical protein L228DRAFT_218350 [Xylona heveae TC161]